MVFSVGSRGGYVAGFGIGLILAIRQVAWTSPESQERLAVWSRQRRPNGERFRSNVFDISSGPDADRCGNFSRAESTSPYEKGEHGWSSSFVVAQQHGEVRARRASKEMALSAALSFGSLLTEAYSLQKRSALVELVEANLPSSEEITDEDWADGVLPSMALITLQIS